MMVVDSLEDILPFGAAAAVLVSGGFARASSIRERRNRNRIAEIIERAKRQEGGFCA